MCQEIPTVSKNPARALSLALVSASGCTVIAVAGAATSVAVGAVSLAGSAIGTAVDIVTPSSSDKKK